MDIEAGAKRKRAGAKTFKRASAGAAVITPAAAQTLFKAGMGRRLTEDGRKAIQLHFSNLLRDGAWKTAAALMLAHGVQAKIQHLPKEWQ